MDNELESSSGWTYWAREAVGVFAAPDALEAAIDELERSGFDRASISVLGTGDKIRKRLGYVYDRVVDLEDDGRAPRSAPPSRDSQAEGEAAAVAVPSYVGGFAGAAAAIASGTVLTAAISATILGAATGAGLGAFLAHAMARRRNKQIEEQLALGGMVLWVNVPDAETENRAISILTKARAWDIHVHKIEREWGPHDRPLSEAQVDPLLERDAAL
jgi:hypothetical protein